MGEQDELQSGRQLLGNAADTFLAAPLRDALIRFGGLSLGVRILAVLGYVFVVVLLVLALVVDLSGTSLAMASWTDSLGESYQIPYLALGAGVVGMILGWAYLLTAATENGRRLFYPLLLFFVADIVWLVASSLGTMAWGCLATPVVLGVGSAYFVTYQRPAWRAWPLLRFAGAVLALALLMLLYWGGIPDETALVENLRGSFILLSWVATLFWVLSGLALVDLTVKVARWLVAMLRRIIPEGRLRAVAMAVVLIHPIPAVLLFFLASRGSLWRHFLLGDGAVALLVLLLGLVFLATRHWDLRNALTSLTLSLVAPVFGLGMALALRGVDLSALAVVAVQETSVIPPLLLFVVVMAYNVFGLMAGFANTEGKVIPRRARILLSFGTALLVIAFAIFFVTIRAGDTGELDQSFQAWTSNIFIISIFVLGIPYLVWVVWKRRERLVGKT